MISSKVDADGAADDGDESRLLLSDVLAMACRFLPDQQLQATLSYHRAVIGSRASVLQLTSHPQPALRSSSLGWSTALAPRARSQLSASWV